MIKKLIKKVKNFWYSPEGTITVAIAVIISTLTAIAVIIATLTAMLIGPVTVLFTCIGAIVIVTIGGLIYILQTAQENEED